MGGRASVGDRLAETGPPGPWRAGSARAAGPRLEPTAVTSEPSGAGTTHSMTLRLPREPPSVAVARHITRHLLEALGATRLGVDDVETGVGEACANAVQHADRSEAFDIAITVEGATCSVWVVDDGPGFSLDQLRPASPDADGGRGLPLMRAVMDGVEVISHPGQGTVVRLAKVLERTA